MRTVHLRVNGAVQGVGFRWFVREAARRLDISGYVMNHPDGSVELAASGSEAAIARLERAVRRGPPGARVDEVQLLPGAEPSELERPFTIRR